MVKVTSDVLDDAALKKMGIISVPGRGQGFNYYITDVDRRNGSEFQKEIINDMSTAAKIWKNKPGCWQDHFRRSIKNQPYHFGMEGGYSSQIGGYNLAIQMLMDTLKDKDGTYYDPPCFCIVPRDWVDEPIHTRCGMEYSTSGVLKYMYSAVKRPDNYVGCLNLGKDPFISAAYAEYGLTKGLFIASTWSKPRTANLGSDHWDWKDLKEPVLWPPIYIVEPGEYWKTGHLVWDCCRFRWVKRGPCDCSPSGGLIKCVDGFYVPAGLGETLCGRERAKFRFKYDEFNMSLSVNSTGGPPYKDIYLEDEFLGTIGLGWGEGKAAGGGWGTINPLKNKHIGIFYNEKTEPCPYGRTPCNSPWGKQIGIDPLTYERQGPCADPVAASRQIYTYQLPETIMFDWHANSPEFKINVNGPFYSDVGFQVWYPYGGIRIEVSPDGINWTSIYTGIVAVTCLEGITEYCYSNWVYSGPINFVKIWISNSTMWECCTKTTISGVEVLDKLRPGFSD